LYALFHAVFPARNTSSGTSKHPCATPMMIFPQLSQHDDDDDSLQQTIEKHV
jgi:hypothetical protein